MIIRQTGTITRNVAGSGSDTTTIDMTFKAPISGDYRFKHFKAVATVNSGTSTYDQAIKINVLKNNVLAGSYIFLAVTDFALAYVDLLLAKGDVITFQSVVDFEDGTVNYTLSGLELTVSTYSDKFTFNQPQLINVTPECNGCDKIGIGDNWFMQLTAPIKEEIEANVVLNPSFADESDWSFSDDFGVPMGASMATFKTTMNLGFGSQIVNLGSGKHYISWNYLYKQDLSDLPYFEIRVAVIRTLTNQPYNYLLKSTDLINNPNIEAGILGEFEVDSPGNHTVFIQIETDTNVAADQIGVDDVLIFPTDRTFPNITNVVLDECGTETEIFEECIQDYVDEDYIECGYVGSEPTSGTISYKVKELTNTVIVTLEVETPVSGEFTFLVTDSDNQTFKTPTFFRPRECDSLISIEYQDYSNCNIDYSELSFIPQYYFSGGLIWNGVQSSERIIAENYKGNKQGVYSRSYQQTGIRVGVYTKDVHSFIARVLDSDYLLIDDVELTADTGTDYTIAGFNNGYYTARADLAIKKSGFVKTASCVESL